MLSRKEDAAAAAAQPLVYRRRPYLWVEARAAGSDRTCLYAACWAAVAGREASLPVECGLLLLSLASGTELSVDQCCHLGVPIIKNEEINRVHNQTDVVKL